MLRRWQPPASNFNSKVDEESQIMATVLSPIKASTLALKGYLLPKTREDAAILSRLAFFGGDISTYRDHAKVGHFQGAPRMCKRLLLICRQIEDWYR